MADYCGLADIKARLPDLDATQDGVIAALITSASAIIDEITQRPDGFGQVSAVRTFDSPDWDSPGGGKRLFVGDIVSVSQVRIKAATTSSWQVAAKAIAAIADPLVAAAAVAGAAGVLTGVYRYGYTWVTAEGETALSPEVAVTLAAQQGSLSGILAGPLGTTSRKVYRTQAGGVAGSGRLVATIADNVTTVLVDNVADAVIAAAAAVPVTNTTGKTGDVLIRPIQAIEAGLPGRYLQLSDIPSSVLGFGSGFDSVEVTGVFGFPAVPAPIKEATIQTVIALWRGRGSGEVEPMGINPVNQPAVSKVVPPMAMDLLRHFRRTVFA